MRLRLALSCASFFVLGSAGVAVAGCAADTTEDASAAKDETGCLGTSSLALKTCAGASTLKGIDVSTYQGDVDWAKVKASGRSFAFARASDGVDHPDATFAKNWPAMKSAGLVRGVYQFFRPTKDIDAQVALLLSKLETAGGLAAGDLPPVLDIETLDGVAPATVATRAKAWLGKVEAALGVKPIVYTASFMSSVTASDFSDYILWVASYGATCPTMPSGWTTWKFWQNASTGSVSGIVGDVDTNLFNGTLPELQAIVVKAPATPAAPAAPPDGAASETDQGSVMGSAAPPKDTASAASTCPK